MYVKPYASFIFSLKSICFLGLCANNFPIMSNLIICEHQFLQRCNRMVINQPDVFGLA